MRLIDTHCHPQMEQYDGDRPDMIQRSLDSDIGLIAIGTTLTDSLAGIRLAEQYADQSVWAAVGIHPTDDDIDDVRVSDLEALTTNANVVGIGECGLDYFHLKHPDDQQLQIDLFEQQILLAQHVNKPLIVHCRDRVGQFGAYDDVLVLLRKHRMTNFVMHCYSGDWKYAEQFLDLGGMLSFTGIVTFPKSDMMHDVVRRVPVERFMVETDAPFLAPVPHRGKRCEPAYVQQVAGKVAELRGVAVTAVERQTTDNAIGFFGLPRA